MQRTPEQERLFRQVMKDGLRIQGRFKAEPVYARTGRGYLKSEGVSTLQKISESVRRRQAV